MRNGNYTRVMCALMLCLVFAFARASHAAETGGADAQTIQLWKFDEPAGTELKDAAKGLKGSPTGGFAAVKGKHGGALQFNGIDAKIAVLSGQRTELGDVPLTIEVWVKVLKHGQTQPIFAAAPFVELEVRGESGVVSFNIGSSDGAKSIRCTGKTDVSDGKWHHVAGIRDKQTKKVKLYIDGRLDAEMRDETAGKALLLPDELYIGGNKQGSEMLGGILDELRITKAVRVPKADASSLAGAKVEKHVLENDHVRLTFDAAGSALSLGGLFDKVRGQEFIAAERGDNLWHASLRSKGGNAILDESEAELKVKRSTKPEGEELEFRWSNLPVADQAGQADVIATVLLPKDSSLSQWRIEIDNRSPEYGVWTARFPRITNFARLSQDGSKDFVAIPGGNGGGAGEGQLYRDPFKTITHPFVRTYPCYHQSMQFNAYYNDKAGVYLATYDGKMNLKGFLIQPQPGPTPTLLYELYHYPADCGVAGTGLKQEYPHILGTFGGDWYDAAQIYRKWALDQVWAQKGPLEKRTDISPWIQDGAYWMVGTFEWEPNQPLLREKVRRMSYEDHVRNARKLDVEKSLELVREARKFFGFPLLLWTNEWFDGGGDISPPRYVPQAGLQEYTRRLHSEFSDVYLSGHMQMKRYSVQLAEYDAEVEKSIEYQPNGQPAIEPLDAMDKGDQIGYPCWTTPFWQNFWNAKAKQIVSYGLDGFHVDELGSGTMFEHQCFNPNHGHPIGGGTMYADTRRHMINMLRESARTVRPGFAIHHEALCEIYLDRVDLAEVCTAPSNLNIPLFEAVYHDYMFFMGRRIHPWMDRRLFHPGDPKFGDNAINEFVASFSQTFIWGNQPGWTRLDIVQYSPRVAEVIKRFMHVRYRNMKFLNTGRYIRPLEVKTQQEMIKTIWTTCDTPEHILPAVLNSVWLASDGSIGIVLANTTDSPRKIHYGYDLAEAGGKHGKWKLRRTDGPAPVDLAVVSGDQIERTDEVPPQSVIVIEAVPVK